MFYCCVRQLAATRSFSTNAHVLLIHHDHDNELNQHGASTNQLYVLDVLVYPWHRTKTMMAEALQLFNVCEPHTSPIDCFNIL